MVWVYNYWSKERRARDNDSTVTPSLLPIAVRMRPAATPFLRDGDTFHYGDRVMPEKRARSAASGREPLVEVSIRR